MHVMGLKGIEVDDEGRYDHDHEKIIMIKVSVKLSVKWPQKPPELWSIDNLPNEEIIQFRCFVEVGLSEEELTHKSTVLWK